MINGPVAKSYKLMKIVDTPGLQDTGGLVQDGENLQKIYEFSKAL
jgi:hypothetical protein